ncbi:hypothetical protein MOUN0_I03180 [Monosporozyma unispora]|nr:hypothetical protein C6P44_001382 [Kazachstania unispora]
MSSPSSPKKSFSFDRWKKIDLLDLADRLNLYVTSNTKKDAVIETIEDFLESLDSPLDTFEYPELTQYYGFVKGDESDPDGERSRLRVRNKVTTINSDNYDDVKSEEYSSSILEENTVDEENSENDITSETTNPIKNNYFNHLFFGNNKSGKVNKCSQFKFNLHECFTDVVNKTTECNERIQEYLADLETVYKIFIIVEFILVIMGIFNVVKSDFGFDRTENIKDHLTEDFTPNLEYSEILVILLTWATLYIGIPVFVGYYFNFAREVYMISVDQMVYNLTKLLVIYVIHSKKLSLLPQSSNYDFINFINKFIGKQTDLDRFSYFMNIITESLGNTPLVFTLISTVLTIYVYILYMS